MLRADNRCSTRFSCRDIVKAANQLLFLESVGCVSESRTPASMGVVSAGLDSTVSQLASLYLPCHIGPKLPSRSSDILGCMATFTEAEETGPEKGSLQLI